MRPAVTHPADRDRVRRQLGAERARWRLIEAAHARRDHPVRRMAQHYLDCLNQIERVLLDEPPADESEGTMNGDHG
jgi:hypothetical protein